MNRLSLTLTAACGLLLPFAPSGFAAPKDYQVTGPILSMTDTTIVVQKGKEPWELSKDATLKAADGSELKVGDKVTLHYTMAVTSVEAKPMPKADAKKSAKAAKTGATATAPAPAAASTPIAAPAPAATP